MKPAIKQGSVEAFHDPDLTAPVLTDAVPAHLQRLVGLPLLQERYLIAASPAQSPIHHGLWRSHNSCFAPTWEQDSNGVG